MQRTLIVPVEPSPEVAEVLRDYGREAARWERRACRAMYAEWRQHGGPRGWKESLLKDYLIEKPGGGFAVDKRNLYTLLLTSRPATRPGRTPKARLTRPVPRGRLRSTIHLQAQLGHLGTSFENFLDPVLREQRRKERKQRLKLCRNVARAKEIAEERGLLLDLRIPRTGETPLGPPKRPRISRRYRKVPNFSMGGLPAFRTPVARFMHTQTTWARNPFGLLDAVVVAHPFERGNLTVKLPCSKDADWGRKLTLIARHLSGELTGDKRPRKAAVEFHEKPAHNGRLQWYAHVCIELPDAQSVPNPERVLGAHIGERDTAATALAVEGGKLSGPAVVHSGRPIRHELDMLAARKRKLRRMHDRGSRAAREALQHIREKEHRLRSLEAHTVSRAIVREAANVGAQGIALENLSRGTPFPRLEERNKGPGAPKTANVSQWNRRVFGWNRGQVQGYVRYKAEEDGFRLAGKNGVSPYWDSHTCPKCGQSYPVGKSSDGGMAGDETRSRKKRLFTCLACGPLNDDVSAAMVVAQRGYRYFNSPRGKRRPSGPSNPTPGTPGAGEGSGVATGHVGGAHPVPQSPTEGGAGVSGGGQPSPGAAPGSTEQPVVWPEREGARASLSSDGASRGSGATSDATQRLETAVVPQVVATDPKGQGQEVLCVAPVPCERGGGEGHPRDRSKGFPSSERDRVGSPGALDPANGKGTLSKEGVLPSRC